MSDIIRDLQLPRCPRPAPRPAPGPRAVPTPLSSHPRARGPADAASPAGGARPHQAQAAATRAPRGLHARLDSGPAGSATGTGRPSPPSLPTASAQGTAGDGALPAGRRTPGSPGRAARRGAWPRPGCPFAAASRRSHPAPPPPRRGSTPGALPPGAQPQSAPALRWGHRSTFPLVPRWEVRGLREAGSCWARHLARRRRRTQRVNPRARDPPPASLTPSGPAPASQISAVEAGFDPAMGVGAAGDQRPEARAAGGRAASTRGGGRGGTGRCYRGWISRLPPGPPSALPAVGAPTRRPRDAGC